MENKEKKSMLRLARASELKPGGVWYYKEASGDFKTVVTGSDNINDVNYKIFCSNSSKLGLMYMNKKKPNYSLSEEMHLHDFYRMQELNN